MATASRAVSAGGLDDEAVYRGVRKAIERILMALFKKGLYFHWYMLHHLAIVYASPKDKRKAAAVPVAWTNDYEIYVSPRFIYESPKTQLFIILHELYHAIFRHASQTEKLMAKFKTVFDRNVVEIIGNILADAVVNEAARRDLGWAPDGIVDTKKVNGFLEEDIFRLGFTQAVHRLLYLIKKGVVSVTVVSKNGTPVDISSAPLSDILGRHGSLFAVFTNKKNGATIKVRINSDLRAGGGRGGRGGGKEDREGGKGKGSGGDEDFEFRDIAKPRKKITSPQEMKKIIEDAKNFHAERASGSKAAGAGVVGAVEVDLGEVYGVKPDWLSLLADRITYFLSSRVLVTWAKPNRRMPGVLPGKIYLGYPTIYILLDVSGSMLGDDLARAVRHIVGIAESYNAKIVLYQWSSSVSLPQEVDEAFTEDIKKNKKILVNTGGTEIYPVLKEIEDKVGKDAAIVVLTDGYIFDIDRADAQKLMKKIARRAGLFVFASTGMIPEQLPPEVVKVTIED